MGQINTMKDVRSL
jgi:hypothetical protein